MKFHRALALAGLVGGVDAAVTWSAAGSVGDAAPKAAGFRWNVPASSNAGVVWKQDGFRPVHPRRTIGSNGQRKADELHLVDLVRCDHDDPNDPCKPQQNGILIVEEPMPTGVPTIVENIAPAPTSNPNSDEPCEPKLSPIVIVEDSDEPTPAPTPCSARQWYVISIPAIAAECTNGYDIPPSAVPDTEFFPTKDACCDATFADGETCVHHDVCTLTSWPTDNPTDRPSGLPSKAPTPPPIAEIVDCFDARDWRMENTPDKGCEDLDPENLRVECENIVGTIEGVTGILAKDACRETCGECEPPENEEVDCPCDQLVLESVPTSDEDCPPNNPQLVPTCIEKGGHLTEGEFCTISGFRTFCGKIENRTACTVSSATLYRVTTDCFSESPTTSPTKNPTASPTAAPTASPTVSESPSSSLMPSSVWSGSSWSSKTSKSSWSKSSKSSWSKSSKTSWSKSSKSWWSGSEGSWDKPPKDTVSWGKDDSWAGTDSPIKSWSGSSSKSGKSWSGSSDGSWSGSSDGVDKVHGDAKAWKGSSSKTSKLFWAGSKVDAATKDAPESSWNGGVVKTRGYDATPKERAGSWGGSKEASTKEKTSKPKEKTGGWSGSKDDSKKKEKTTSGWSGSKDHSKKEKTSGDWSGSKDHSKKDKTTSGWSGSKDHSKKEKTTHWSGSKDSTTWERPMWSKSSKTSSWSKSSKTSWSKSSKSWWGSADHSKKWVGKFSWGDDGNHTTTDPTTSEPPDLAESTVDLPILADDLVQTNMNEAVTFLPLENDPYVPAGAGGSFADPANGSISLQPDGVVYTPSLDFCGTDQFTYTVTDPTGEFPAMATVTVVVACAEAIEEIPTNEQPVLNDDSAETDANTEVSIPVLENDSYVPPSGSASMSQPSQGTAIIERDSVLYVPNEDFCGTDQFTYTVTDATGELSDTATVTVVVICSTISTAAATTSPTTTAPAIVNPVANDDFATTNQGTSVVLLLLDNDIVPEGATGSFTDPANGSLGADGADLTYTPSPDFCGQDMFAYTLSAGDLSDSATVTVDVVCDSGATSTTGPTDGGSTPPAIVELSVEDDFAVGNMNEALSIPVLDNDTLPANAGGAFGKPEHGTVVEPTENGLVYMPNEDWCGFDTFDYTITSGDLSDSANVTVHILCADTTVAPIVEVSTTSSTPGSTAVPNTLACTTSMNGPVIVDPESDDVTLTGDANHGTCTITEESTVMFTPNSGFAGYDECTFSACDSSGSCSPGVMSITVLPVASAIEKTTAVEQAVSIPLGELYDFQHTTVEVHFDPADGVLDTSDATSLIYTPNAGFEGTEVLKYSLCTIATPVLCDESTISIVVEAVSADLLSNAESGESEESTTTSESFSSNKVAMGFVAVLGSTIVVAAVLVTMRDRGATAGEKFDENKHWWKTIHRAGNAEASSLTPGESREIQFAGSSNLSVTAFLTGEATSPEDSSKRSSLFRSPAASVVPASPANSLFSMSPNSTKDLVIDDVVDL
ncbi:hypothetical protein ACHAXT_012310 [Thalassiosira profunda]